jgi:hypothetical protein
MDKANGEIGFNEETEINWRNNLRTFRENVWPVLQEEGLTDFNIAYMTWHLSMMHNTLEELRETVDDRGFNV